MKMRIDNVLFVILLTLTFVMVTAGTIQITMENGLINYNGHDYQLFTVLRTWLEAKADCEALDGHLVTITSSEENYFVNNLVGGNAIWIGFTDRGLEGTWGWITDESITYSNWGPREPNGGIFENYAEMTSTGEWKDVFEKTNFYVCEWDNRRITNNGHEYQLISISKTWVEAKMSCIARGGYLVTITSSDENDFVTNLAGENIIWIGMTDELIEGSWQWVTGEYVTYTNWDRGEPNDAAGGEDYAEMLDHGLWNDIGPPGDPNVFNHYVCEWENNTTDQLNSNSTSVFLFWRIILFVAILITLFLFIIRNRRYL